MQVILRLLLSGAFDHVVIEQLEVVEVPICTRTWVLRDTYEKLGR
jgi:hypothetical protein